MAIKPGPQLITINTGASSINLLADSISTLYATEFFDRVEFDREKLRTAPLSTGVTPIIVQLLGNVPAEIVIDCALEGMIGGAGAYVPRPLAPNSYPSGFSSIKQRMNIVRYQITGGTSPESASLGTNVDNVFNVGKTHKHLLSQFQNRLAILNTQVPYEQLISAQADNIQTTYFTTGVTLTAPGISVSNMLISDFSHGLEYAIPDGSGGFTIRKGFNMVIEVRTVADADDS